MEQGPILEAKGLPLGVVTGIAGQTRQYVMMSGTQVTANLEHQHAPCPEGQGTQAVKTKMYTHCETHTTAAIHAELV